MDLLENYLQLLFTDKRSQAKEWRGANNPVDGKDYRINWIGECMRLEGDRMKIRCLRKLREQTAMNPFYQYRIDRFIDAITNTYEPTEKPGTIPGNEFRASRVGDDLTEGRLLEYAEGISKEKWEAAMKRCHAYADNIPNAKTKDDIKKAYWKCMSRMTGKNFQSRFNEGAVSIIKGHMKHAPKITEWVRAVKANDSYDIRKIEEVCKRKPRGERKRCVNQGTIKVLEATLGRLQKFMNGSIGREFRGGCNNPILDKQVCKRIFMWEINRMKKRINKLKSKL